LHPSGVAKSSTSFGWGKGGKVTSAGWQVTLCDLIWHVISRSGVVISITNCYIRFTLLYFTFNNTHTRHCYRDNCRPTLRTTACTHCVVAYLELTLPSTLTVETSRVVDSQL